MASTSPKEDDAALSEWEIFANLTTNIGNTTTLSLNTNTYWNELFKNPVYRASWYINNNMQFILTGIGIPFNILSFLVLRRIKPITSAILIMSILAVVDSLKLGVECSNRLIQLGGFSYKDVGCSFVMTARYFLQYIPIWLVVLLTVDRVVAVCFPLKAVRICTMSNARRSVFVFFILDGLICIVHTFLYEELFDTSMYGCYLKSKYLRFLMKFYLPVDAASLVIIPLVLLCLGNSAIIVKLRTSREIYDLSDNSTLSQESRRQNRSITVMLLTVCITTTVCLAPNVALAFPGLISWTYTQDLDVGRAAWKELAKRLIILLTDVNNAVNFFLYILSGRRFRGVLREMVSSWIKTGMQKR